MGLGWPIMFRLLEDGCDFGLLFPDHASCNDRLERLIIAVNTRGEPECDPQAVVGALRRPCFKRTCTEGSK